MKALVLKQRVKQDIKTKVDRILSELGNPEPPLRLEEVRDLLELDLSFFSGESDGLLDVAFSRLKRAGKQIIKRPTLLRDAIKKFDLRALYLPDRKRILIDDSIAKPKHRWLEAHEIGHDLLPWHGDMMLGDDSITPTPSVREKIEAEANYAAGALLFLTDLFMTECKDVEPTLASVNILKRRYNNTFTTTLWRMIEYVGEDLPMFGLIGQHPSDFYNEEPNFRHLIPSSSFHEMFEFPSIENVTMTIMSYCRRGKGPLGQRNIVLHDRDGRRHEFHMETFYNGYDALTLGRYIRKLPTTIIAGL